MPLEPDEPRLRGRFEEGRIERLVGELERDVHPGAASRRDPVRIEARSVYRPVEAARLALVARGHGREAALPLDPFEHQGGDVPRERARGVGHGPGRGLRGVADDGGGEGVGPIEQVLAHDDDREARHAQVLLRAGVDEPEASHVDRARQDVRRHVGDEGRPARIRSRNRAELDPRDGLVGDVVEVGRSGRDLPLFTGRDGPVAVALRGRRHPHPAEAPRLGDGARRPGPGVDVARGSSRAREIERDRGELHLRPSLEEEHAMGLRDLHQPAKARLEPRRELQERRAAVALLRHRDARAVPVGEVLADPLDDGRGQCGGARAEVDRSLSHAFSPGAGRSPPRHRRRPLPRPPRLR